jgi:hypothetical protein
MTEGMRTESPTVISFTVNISLGVDNDGDEALVIKINNVIAPVSLSDDSVEALKKKIEKITKAVGAVMLEEDA